MSVDNITEERMPSTVYGGDINALLSLANIYENDVTPYMDDWELEKAQKRQAHCKELAVKIGELGLEALEDDDWPMWPSQVAAVEDRTTTLPVAELVMSDEDRLLHRTARKLRAYGQIILLP